jgi:uncharacterized membrane protein
MDKGRLEAFSDGVFAVAITLLVFGLAVAHVGRGHLAGALGHEWPRAVAYVVSFMVIGIIWINHHAVLGLVKQADRVILAVNLALLLAVVSIPFATGPGRSSRPLTRVGIRLPVRSDTCRRGFRATRRLGP